MTNPRDTGRYDAFTDSYVDTNVRIDFAWGNIPMQPNDDRGMAQLDPELDSHIIATSGYEGFPAFITGGVYDDTTPNAVVPNLVGMLTGLAYSAVDAVGLNYSVDDTRVTGATVANDSHVYSQSPAAGTIANVGDTVYTVIYEAPLVPNVVGLTNSAAQAALVAAGLVLGTSTPTSTGATSQNNGKVKTQSVAAGTQVDAGSTVNVTIYNYVGANTNIAGFSQNSFPGHVALTGNDVYMYLYLRVTKPTVGSTITVADNANTTLNQNYTVVTVEDNDSYNTGGTVVKLTGLTQAVVNPAANVTIGTWITV